MQTKVYCLWCSVGGWWGSTKDLKSWSVHWRPNSRPSSTSRAPQIHTMDISAADLDHAGSDCVVKFSAGCLALSPTRSCRMLGLCPGVPHTCRGTYQCHEVLPRPAQMGLRSPRPSTCLEIRSRSSRVVSEFHLDLKRNQSRRASCCHHLPEPLLTPCVRLPVADAGCANNRINLVATRPQPCPLRAFQSCRGPDFWPLTCVQSRRI